MKKSLMLLVLLSLGCSRHPTGLTIKVAITDHYRSVSIAGFDKEIINDIAQNSTDSAWSALLPVYKMPRDTDMKDFQNPQPGKYRVSDSLVIFTPDTPFSRGQLYFVRSFDYGQAKDAWAYLREKKKHGTAGHKDLPFKY